MANPLNCSPINGARAAVDICLEEAEHQKHDTDHPMKCEESGRQCLPVAVTPYGNIKHESLVSLRKIRTDTAFRTRSLRPLAIVYRDMVYHCSASPCSNYGAATTLGSARQFRQFNGVCNRNDVIIHL